jgi:hypothetical protein
MKWIFNSKDMKFSKKNIFISIGITAAILLLVASSTTIKLSCRNPKFETVGKSVSIKCETPSFAIFCKQNSYERIEKIVECKSESGKKYKITITTLTEAERAAEADRLRKIAEEKGLLLDSFRSKSLQDSLQKFTEEKKALNQYE